MRRRILQFTLLIIIFCLLIGCNATQKKDDKTDNYIYHNENYGFTLEIPNEAYNVELVEVSENKEKYDNSTSFEFTFGRTNKDGTEVSGIIFEIIVCDGSDVYPESEVLLSSGEKTYCFLTVEGPTESMGFNELLEELKPMVKEIKDSFKLE